MAGRRTGPGPGSVPRRSASRLPAHDGSRPHLALDVDPLLELGVVDVGDVEMPPGNTELSLQRLEAAVTRIAASGAIPVVLGGDHTIALPDVTGVARHVGWGRVSVIHFDAHADTGNTQFGSLHGHGTPMRRLIESGRHAGTASCRSACVATGPSPRRWRGWPSSRCAATR